MSVFSTLSHRRYARRQICTLCLPSSLVLLSLSFSLTSFLARASDYDTVATMKNIGMTKSADTIDVMCSLCRYESIQFALLARRRLCESTVTSSCTYDIFFCKQMEFDDTRDIRTLCFFLFLVSVLEIKILLWKMIGSRLRKCRYWLHRKRHQARDRVQKQSRFTWWWLQRDRTRERTVIPLKRACKRVTFLLRLTMRDGSLLIMRLFVGETSINDLPPSRLVYHYTYSSMIIATK